MKGKIDKLGYLWIERANLYITMKEQHCLEHPKTTICGHWCPQFGEPEPIYAGENITPDLIEVEICQGRVLQFDEFADERKNTTANEED